MITIKHLTGPLAGQEAQFADDRERIVFGRDPALCDVVFPPEFTTVGREHFALLREISGDYAIEAFGDHYVEVDGAPVTLQSSVPAKAVIRLGRHDGPTLHIAVDHAQVSAGLKKTEDQDEVVPPPVVASSARRFALGALGLAVLAAAGFGLFAYQSEQERNRQRQIAQDLAQQLVDLKEREKAQAAELISTEDRKRLAASVYAVIRQDVKGGESLLGTAWAVRPNQLATNAHVAGEFADLKPGEHLLVRPSGGGGDQFRIDGVVIHPGYDALKSFLERDPFFVSGFGAPRKFDYVPGYDVALLHVKKSVPPNMILAIEAPEKIAALTPGDPVALAGFPYENMLGDEVQPLGRTPQLQVGNVTSLSDFFLLPAVPEQRRLVQNNLPIAGGASGSPVIDANGKVIAIASAGNMFSIDGERIPSAALVNYAQRVDALADLLNGAAKEKLQSDQDYWARQTAAFKRRIELVIPNILDAAKPGDGQQPALVGEYRSESSPSFVVNAKSDGGAPVSYHVRSFTLPIGANSQHVFLAYAQNSAPIVGLLVAVNGKTTAHAERAGVNAVYLSYKPPKKDQTVTLLVATPDEDSVYVVRDYVWQATP